MTMQTPFTLADGRAIDLGPLPQAPKVGTRLIGLHHHPTVHEVVATQTATLPDGSTVTLPTGTMLRDARTH